MKRAIEILEALYATYDSERKGYAKSEESLDYLTGRCDAIEEAIQMLENEMNG